MPAEVGDDQVMARGQGVQYRREQLAGNQQAVQEHERSPLAAPTREEGGRGAAARRPDRLIRGGHRRLPPPDAAHHSPALRSGRAGRPSLSPSTTRRTPSSGSGPRPVQRTASSSCARSE